MLGCVVHAAPLMNYPCTITQPDGTEIDLFLNGDEYFGYITDKDGAVIIRNSDTGEYSYAKILNNELVPSDNIVGDTAISVMEEEKDTSKIYFKDIPESYVHNEIETKKREKERGNSGITTTDLSETNIATMGFNGETLNNIVIFVEFDDIEFLPSHKSYSYYDGLFNTNEESMANFYREVSYGQTIVNSVLATPDSNDTIVMYKSENQRSYYESDYDKLHELMDEAVAWAIDENYIPDNMNYDANGDGVIDCVTFIFAGDVQNYGERVFWPQAWWGGYIYTPIQGKLIERYIIIPERLLYNSNTGLLFQRNESTLCHESFHAIFEGQDLYDNSLNGSWNSKYGVYGNALPVRKWDIMCASPGAHMSSYIKYRYGGWINIPEIKQSGTYTLKPLKTKNDTLASGTLNDTVAYILRSPVPVSGTDDISQYFIVEYRKYDGSFETSNNLSGNGLVIYRVNSNFCNLGNNYYNVDDNNSKYEIEEIYPKYSSMELKYSNNKSSGITLSNVTINSSGDLSFNVTMPTTRNLMYFNDPRLAEAVKDVVGKPYSEITAEDISAIESLSISIDYNELSLDLSGMEYMTGLTYFSAPNCKIEDITPLQSLDDITYLNLQNNNIKDISALTNMQHLETLKLRGNLIEDYSPTQSYYDKIATKDFTLTSMDDIVFYVPKIQDSGSINIAYIIKNNQYLPRCIYCTAEIYSANGDLLNKIKKPIDIVSNNNPAFFSISQDYSFDDESYIVLNAYEREDEKQLMSRAILKASSFDLNSLN